MKWNANLMLALVLLIFAMIIFSLVIFMKLGGDTVLGVIIGHVAAWGQMAVIYYFRKKPPVPPAP